MVLHSVTMLLGREEQKDKEFLACGGVVFLRQGPTMYRNLTSEPLFLLSKPLGCWDERCLVRLSLCCVTRLTPEFK